MVTDVILKNKIERILNEMNKINRLCKYCSCLVNPFKKGAPRRKRKMSLTLTERCTLVLRDSLPLDIPELLDELERRGLEPRGKTPRNTVSATVSERCGRKPGHPQTFSRTKIKGRYVYSVL